MARGSFERKSKNRPTKTTFCLVVEGIKTERLYFVDAKREYDRLQHEEALASRSAGQPNVSERSMVVVSANGRSFENVLNTAMKELGVGHERIYCVVDADFYVRLNGSDKKQADILYDKALEAGIEVILSNPCFEVWFRHHFNADASAWSNGTAAKTAIHALWPDYENKPERHWDLLKDRLHHAVQNADRVKRHHGAPPRLVEDCNASTNVDWLILDLFCCP